ncbi:MAG: signal peptidase I, partial [Thermodesulfovibrionales bacterium]
TVGAVLEGKNKVVFVNGNPLTETYVQYPDKNILFEKRDHFGPIKVSEGKLFVMGDNRDQSYDSRYWGFVDRSYVRGKAFILYWSWDRTKHWVRFNRIGRLIE